MELKVFTVRDSKAEFFSPPFFNKTHGEAERNFRTLANDQNSMINKHPEDYDLYFVGTFDDSTGKMTTHDTPQHVVKAINLLNA